MRYLTIASPPWPNGPERPVLAPSSCAVVLLQQHHIAYGHASSNAMQASMTRRRRPPAGRRRDRKAAQVLAKLSVGPPAARDRVVELVRVLLPEEAAHEATQPSRVGIVGRAATLDDVLRP
jgi:hypothetical protein